MSKTAIHRELTATRRRNRLLQTVKTEPARRAVPAVRPQVRAR